MKSPTCAVYKVNRDTGFNDNSPYDVYCAPPGLHTATYNRKTGEWVVYQPLTVEDAAPNSLVMVAWVDEEGLVTTATAPDLDALSETAPTWVYYLANSVIPRRNEVRWFESGCSAVTSNLTSNLTSKEIL